MSGNEGHYDEFSTFGLEMCAHYEDLRELKEHVLSVKGEICESYAKAKLAVHEAFDYRHYKKHKKDSMGKRLIMFNALVACYEDIGMDPSKEIIRHEDKRKNYELGLSWVK